MLTSIAILLLCITGMIGAYLDINTDRRLKALEAAAEPQVSTAPDVSHN
jgi:hypothetical protein